MIYSGFTFVHNALVGGYPIREAVKAVQPFVSEVVAVDMGSTDGTREVLESLGCRVIDGKWGTKAEQTLKKAHALHTECKHENIIHFEADEVWDDFLITHIIWRRLKSAIVHRIQVEQNFQRIRWAAHQVHRVFQRGTVTKAMDRGHTTDQHDEVQTILSPEYGVIWDCSYVFRDNHVERMKQNATLWNGEEPQYLRRTPQHFLEKPFADNLEKFLAEPQWTWKTSPFRLPDVLKPLVGKTRYE